MENFVKIPVQTTFMEVLSSSKPIVASNLLLNNKLKIEQIFNIELSFYKYLYNAIGKNYGWSQRLVISDHELQAILDNPNVAIFILYVEDAPAGFAEFANKEAGTAELKYFGILEHAQGKGVSSYFLQTVLKNMWQKNLNRIILTTCEYDSPKAKSFYIKNGFAIYNESICNEYYPKEFVEKLKNR